MNKQGNNMLGSIGVNIEVEIIKCFDFLLLGPPLAPKSLRVIEADSSHMVLEWDTPQGDGGSPITGYSIEKRDAKRDEFTHVANVDARTSKFKVTRLFEGTDYYFRVFAENLAGLSPPCTTERPVRAKPPYGKKIWTSVIKL